MRFIVAIAFIGILCSLGSAVVFLMKDTGNSKRMAYALTVRIGLSVLLFLFVLFAHWMGWIQFTGLR
ncbi:MAG: twin transmembrane helix small protein [Pigmentiphaga sp.]|uniref:twin transmembrane helix small protein n=1 Tax=Pigmentiphaga sp. TaxID=1977564 RepID=UPI0029BC9ADC|nr:twin transmembrane helix small protein [Pigmentiphaga sp.]MDX3907967.1 twin transmembrane helix small protein [Pigmentiphaga sp.]